MKIAVLALGLWLAGAQGFAAQVCCSEMPAPKASCDSCGGQTGRDSSPRPDCCTSLEAQKDIDAAVELLSDDKTFSPWRPETTDTVVRQAASRAEGLPLYLRCAVLLI